MVVNAALGDLLRICGVAVHRHGGMVKSISDKAAEAVGALLTFKMTASALGKGDEGADGQMGRPCKVWADQRTPDELVN